MVRGRCWTGPHDASRAPCDLTSAGTNSQGLETPQFCASSSGHRLLLPPPPCHSFQEERGLSCLPGTEAAAARGGWGRRSCLLLCHLACQPIFCSLTLVATQESHGMDKALPGTHSASPGAGCVGCRVDVAVSESRLLFPALLWPPGTFRHQPGWQGSLYPSSPTRARILSAVK